MRTNQNKDLGLEILHRLKVYDFKNLLVISAPCPSQWKAPELIKWLVNHLISLQDNGVTPASIDVAFIKAKLESVRQQLIIADDKTRLEHEPLGGTGWASILFYR